MKAAQIVSHRKFDIVDVDTPDISSDQQGTVLVKSYQSAICGSDMPLFDLKYPEGSSHCHWDDLSTNVSEQLQAAILTVLM